LVCFVGCGGGGPSAPASPTPTPAAVIRPNIVLVVTDDLDVPSAAVLPQLDGLRERVHRGERDVLRVEEGVAVEDNAALRTDRWSYVELSSNEYELYDLVADPYELQSLHGTAGPEVMGPLAARLHELTSCRGVACR